MKTDIEIAQECTMEPITAIAEKAGIPDEYLEQYGKYKAKIDYNFLKKSQNKDGKLILVTAINPTPAGEGKTTTTVGLADAMQRLNKKVMVALREPLLDLYSESKAVLPVADMRKLYQWRISTFTSPVTFTQLELPTTY